jgi:hypothetical protein
MTVIDEDYDPKRGEGVFDVLHLLVDNTTQAHSRRNSIVASNDTPTVDCDDDYDPNISAFDVLHLWGGATGKNSK